MKLESEYPFVVIGGGPAGTAAAITLARAGHKVALLDRDIFPRDKLCGEFLSGESRRLLEELGCLSDVMAHAPPAVEAMRFVSVHGNEITARLPHAALGISRLRLDNILLNHAARNGVEVHQGVEVLSINHPGGGDACATIELRNASQGAVTQLLQARIVIAAHGRNSKLDRSLERAFTRRPHAYVGMKLHHRWRNAENEAELGHVGEVYIAGGGYCGVCSIEGGMVNVCALLHKDALQHGAKWPEVMARLSTLNPYLGRRLELLEPAGEPVQTVSQVPFETKDLSCRNIFYVGDAAGMIAPLCGDGQAMALDSGIRLGRILSTSSGSIISVLTRQWKREWTAAYRRRLALGRLLQFGVLRGPIANAAIRTLSVLPTGVVDTLARKTRG